jgi:hypothetical protein
VIDPSALRLEGKGLCYPKSVAAQLFITFREVVVTLRSGSISSFQKKNSLIPSKAELRIVSDQVLGLELGSIQPSKWVEIYLGSTYQMTQLFRAQGPL